MSPPKGYFKAVPCQVCKLQKSLYGLKQAGRQWNKQFTTKLKDYGFIQSIHDHCLFIKGSDSDFLALLAYIDDVLVTSVCEKSVEDVKTYLHAQFAIKGLGPAKIFLGLKIARSESRIYICQRKYILDIINEFGL